MLIILQRCYAEIGKFNLLLNNCSSPKSLLSYPLTNNKFFSLSLLSSFLLSKFSNFLCLKFFALTNGSKSLSALATLVYKLFNNLERVVQWVEALYFDFWRALGPKTSYKHPWWNQKQYIMINIGWIRLTPNRQHVDLAGIFLCCLFCLC